MWLERSVRAQERVAGEDSRKLARDEMTLVCRGKQILQVFLTGKWEAALGGFEQRKWQELIFVLKSSLTAKWRSNYSDSKEVIIAVIQVRKDGGSTQGSSSGGRENWQSLYVILKVVTKFDNGLGMWCENKREVIVDSKSI